MRTACMLSSISMFVWARTSVLTHTILFFILALCLHEVLLLLLLLPLLLGAHTPDDRIAYSRGVSAQGHLAAGKQDSTK
jgi:inner membrane protein involved in colicin E2 resistance